MRTFVFSVVIFFIITVFGILFIFLLGNSVDALSNNISEVLDCAQSGRWSDCKSAFSRFEEKWEISKRKYEPFINHREIDLINEAIVELKSYVEFKNTEKTVTKAALLKMLLNYIFDNELPTIENIL